MLLIKLLLCSRLLTINIIEIVLAGHIIYIIFIKNLHDRVGNDGVVNAVRIFTAESIHADQETILIKQRTTGVTMRNKGVVLECRISLLGRYDICVRDDTGVDRLAGNITGKIRINFCCFIRITGFDSIRVTDNNRLSDAYRFRKFENGHIQVLIIFIENDFRSNHLVVLEYYMDRTAQLFMRLNDMTIGDQILDFSIDIRSDGKGRTPVNIS